MIWMIAGAILIGLTLGLMGSGGSILTVPVLVYVLGHDKDLAVAESMAIVGLIALVAAIPNVWSKLVDWRSVLFFGIPGMLGTLAGAWLGANYLSGAAKLSFFALVMLVAAWSMFRRQDQPEDDSKTSTDRPAINGRQILKIATEGVIVGIVTGIVGVGGGFLIVPALVILGGLSMRLAVGTSLVIILMKCVVGFAEYQYEFWRAGTSVDWETIGVFAVLGAIGSFAGRWIGHSLKQSTLRNSFAVLLIIMAVFIIAREAPLLFQQKAAESPAVSLRLEAPTPYPLTLTRNRS